LIRYPHINKTQLFDLANDPREMNDLADKPEYASKVKEMMALLEKTQPLYGDTVALTSATPQDPSWSPDKAGGEKPRKKRKENR